MKNSKNENLKTKTCDGEDQSDRAKEAAGPAASPVGRHPTGAQPLNAQQRKPSGTGRHFNGGPQQNVNLADLLYFKKAIMSMCIALQMSRGRCAHTVYFDSARGRVLWLYSREKEVGTAHFNHLHPEPDARAGRVRKAAGA